jgi:DNA-binding PadR family transcriptional regulator
VRSPVEEDCSVAGTLNRPILRTSLFGNAHGEGIARDIQTTSGDELLAGHGLLYPTLQRLEAKGWAAEFYRFTPAGREQLTSETKQWERIAAAVGRDSGG